MIGRIVVRDDRQSLKVIVFLDRAPRPFLAREGLDIGEHPDDIRVARDDELWPSAITYIEGPLGRPAAERLVGISLESVIEDVDLDEIGPVIVECWRGLGWHGCIGHGDPP